MGWILLFVLVLKKNAIFHVFHFIQKPRRIKNPPHTIQVTVCPVCWYRSKLQYLIENAISQNLSKPRNVDTRAICCNLIYTLFRLKNGQLWVRSDKISDHLTDHFMISVSWKCLHVSKNVFVLLIFNQMTILAKLVACHTRVIWVNSKQSQCVLRMRESRALLSPSPCC